MGICLAAFLSPDFCADADDEEEVEDEDDEDDEDVLLLDLDVLVVAGVQTLDDDVVDGFQAEDEDVVVGACHTDDEDVDVGAFHTDDEEDDEVAAGFHTELLELEEDVVAFVLEEDDDGAVEAAFEEELLEDEALDAELDFITELDELLEEAADTGLLLLLLLLPEEELRDGAEELLPADATLLVEDCAEELDEDDDVTLRWTAIPEARILPDGAKARVCETLDAIDVLFIRMGVVTDRVL
ncbi:hypothetical protein EMMF5_004186 [Cystobasidiomycetes sp. EMM_F5]